MPAWASRAGFSTFSTIDSEAEFCAMQDDDQSTHEPALVSTRTMDIVVALLFLLASAVVLYDTNRLGFNWIEGEGPASGYFPFYIALVMAGASLVNLLRAVIRIEPGGDGVFVSARAFGRVLTVLVPVLLYVALIGGVSLGPVAIPRLGIYLASALFMLAFMIVVGRESPIKAIVVALVAPVALFVTFEKLFLVPLPKCTVGFCDGIEEMLVGVPYDKLLQLLRALRHAVAG